MRGSLNILSLIDAKCNTIMNHEDNKSNLFIIPASPASGVLFVTSNSPHFISGHLRLRGRDRGRYPYNYLELIDRLFGREENTIEVCSGSIRSKDCFTVDINPDISPVLVDDGQELCKIPDDTFSRWRCDPPYNPNTAEKMYGTALPNTRRLLEAGARVCKIGSLMFLLLGPQNYQCCPPRVRRIGWIAITIVPNNEIRALHIFYKYDDSRRKSR